MLSWSRSGRLSCEAYIGGEVGYIFQNVRRSHRHPSFHGSFEENTSEMVRPEREQTLFLKVLRLRRIGIFFHRLRDLPPPPHPCVSMLIAFRRNFSKRRSDLWEVVLPKFYKGCIFESKIRTRGWGRGEEYARCIFKFTSSFLDIA